MIGPILKAVSNWREQGKPVALATVAGTWGSSPRPAGSLMAVSGEGEIAGSVSGGCVEGAVVREALEVLEHGTARLLHFGVSDEQAWSVGLSCGGSIEVLVQPLAAGWWQTLGRELERNRPLATVLVLEGEFAGARVLARRGKLVFADDRLPGPILQQMLGAARRALLWRSARQLEVAGTRVLAGCLRPRPRLIIVGGAHTAVALHRLAAEIGFRVFVIDPRTVFATRQRFPRAEKIFHLYPDEVLPSLELDAETALAVLTHDPKIDDPALLSALPGAVGYVGVLSSRTTHQKRVRRLLDAGLAPPLLERIHTPIGLDLGARTPEEIALAILAEIVQVRNRGDF